jgi:hypothetical protein
MTLSPHSPTADICRLLETTNRWSPLGRAPAAYGYRSPASGFTPTLPLRIDENIHAVVLSVTRRIQRIAWKGYPPKFAMLAACLQPSTNKQEIRNMGDAPGFVGEHHMYGETC